MLNTLDRYIIKRFFIYFVGNIILLTTLYLAIESLSLMAQTSADLLSILQYQFYALPGMNYQFFPFACLLGTLMSLIQLNRENEILAAISLGISPFRICVSIFGIVVLMTTLLFFLNDRLGHYFEQKKKYYYYVEIKQEPHLYSTAKKGRIWFRSDNILFNVKGINKPLRTVQGLTMYYFSDNWELIQMVTADKVEIYDDVWRLFDGFVQLGSRKEFGASNTFERKVIRMPEGIIDFDDQKTAIQSLPLNDLEEFIETNRRAGLDTTQYEVDYHAKLGYVLTPLIMVLLGVPFSIRQTKAKDIVRGFAIGLFLALIFWLIHNMSLVMGRNALISPWVSAWVGNLVAGAGALFLIFKRS